MSDIVNWFKRNDVNVVDTHVRTRQRTAGLQGLSPLSTAADALQKITDTHNI